MFNPLGYDVYPRIEDKKKYELYVKNSPRGLEWFGSIPDEFDDPQDVILKCKELNSTRILPTYCYDPIMTEKARYQCAFQEYCKRLGFEESSCFGDIDSMVYNDIYGKQLFKISLKISYNESDKDMIVYYPSQSSMQSIEFDDLDSLVTAVNSIVKPLILTNITKELDMMNAWTDSIGDTDITVVEGLNIFTTKTKEITIKQLEEALKKLKNT